MHENEISKLLDQHCGIDFIVFDNKKAYGVASRINFNKKHHGCVTIRYKRMTGGKTEYQKRIESIEKADGQIYASITMQVDSVNNKATSGIVFQSDKLYLAIKNNFDYFEEQHMRKNEIDGNLYFRFTADQIKMLADTFDFKCSFKSFQ